MRSFSSAHMTICIALFAMAVSSQPMLPQRFNFFTFCNDSSFDSMRSSLNGTRCFNARQEFVGVTDWLLTDEVVLSQFRNMESQPFL